MKYVRLGTNALGTGLLVVGIAACGGTAAPSTGGAATPPASPTPTNLTLKAAAAAYLADVGPDNVAGAKFSAVAATWTNSTTDAQAEAAAQPLLAADSVFEHQLEDTNWPGSAEADARALAGAMAQIDASLETLSAVNFLNAGTWEQGFASAEAASLVDANEVRHDLGLPPAS